MNTWALRAIWISMPLTAGSALADAMHPWRDASRTTGAVLLWVGWTIVLLATLVPRPWSTTVTRFALPIGLGVTIVAAGTGRPSTIASTAAILGAVVACLLGTRGEFVRACAQGAAYGDEERFPLKVPPGVLIAILPIAIAIVAATTVVAPLLLADDHWIAGALVVAVGVPLSAFVIRLAHQLSRRWVVLVPAGLVIADPLTLTDPVLFPRARIAGFGPADPSRKPPTGACDLRLGAAFGSCALLLTDDADIMRRVRNQGVAVQANLLLVTPAGAPKLLDRARARRIHVRTE